MIHKLTDRHKRILDLKAEGCSFVEIARIEGVSRPLVARMFYQASMFLRSEASPGDSLHGLPLRLSRLLERSGLSSRSAVKDALSSGKLSPGNLGGYGCGSHLQVLTWLERKSS